MWAICDNKRTILIAAPRNKLPQNILLSIICAVDSATHFVNTPSESYIPSKWNYPCIEERWHLKVFLTDAWRWRQNVMQNLISSSIASNKSSDMQNKSETNFFAAVVCTFPVILDIHHLDRVCLDGTDNSIIRRFKQRDRSWENGSGWSCRCACSIFFAQIAQESKQDVAQIAQEN